MKPRKHMNLTKSITMINLAIMLSACSAQQSNVSHFTPGLGEIMAQSASRHAKLWFAGQAENWQLVAYEIDELHEGFEDAETFHPTHKKIVQPISELIEKFMKKPIADLKQSVQDHNLELFNSSYYNLTVACNSCHQTTGYGYIQVTQPTLNPFTNQLFPAN